MGLNEKLDRIRDELNRLRAENERLKEALNLYGRHGRRGGDICESSKHSDYPCTCGFDEALKD